MLSYRLEPRAIQRRALAIALAESGAMLAPAALVTLLLARDGAFASRPVLLASGVLFVLAFLRVLGARARLVRRLGAFELQLDERHLRVASAGGDHVVPLAQIVRATVRSGQLGGMRIFVKAADRASTDLLYIDVPGGGQRFAELRSVVLALPAIQGPPGGRWRGLPVLRFARAGRIALFVTSFIFVPFLVDDLLARSRVAAYATVVIVGVVLRWNVRRSAVG